MSMSNRFGMLRSWTLPHSTNIATRWLPSASSTSNLKFWMCLYTIFAYSSFFFFLHIFKTWITSFNDENDTRHAFPFSTASASSKFMTWHATFQKKTALIVHNTMSNNEEIDLASVQRLLEQARKCSQIFCCWFCIAYIGNGGKSWNTCSKCSQWKRRSALDLSWYYPCLKYVHKEEEEESQVDRRILVDSCKSWNNLLENLLHLCLGWLVTSLKSNWIDQRCSHVGANSENSPMRKSIITWIILNHEKVSPLAHRQAHMLLHVPWYKHCWLSFIAWRSNSGSLS